MTPAKKMIKLVNPPKNYDKGDETDDVNDKATKRAEGDDYLGCILVMKHIYVVLVEVKVYH